VTFSPLNRSGYSTMFRIVAAEAGAAGETAADTIAVTCPGRGHAPSGST
jgi:hypothetical protein